MDEVLAESAVPEKVSGDHSVYATPTIKTELPVIIKPFPKDDPDSSLETSNSQHASNTQTSSPILQSSREALIQTAVSFLQNPKTFKASDAEKRSFLLKKGLSTSEIEQAFFIVSGSNNTSSTFEQKSDALFPGQVENRDLANFNIQSGTHFTRNESIRRRPASLATVIGQFSVALSLVGGLAWGLYHVIKSYLIPLFLASRQQEKRLKKQENTLHQMSLTLEAINSQLANYCDPNTAPYKNGRIDKDKNYEVLKEVLEELRSLKRLTLSKDSFPPPPKIQPITIQKRSVTSSNEVSRDTNADGLVIPLNNESAESENVFPRDSSRNQTVGNQFMEACDENSSIGNAGHLNGFRDQSVALGQDSEPDEPSVDSHEQDVKIVSDNL